MRAVIQRVSKADVAISGAVKAAIQHGLLVFLAIEESDAAQDIEWLSGKIVTKPGPPSSLSDIFQWF